MSRGIRVVIGAVALGLGAAACGGSPSTSSSTTAPSTTAPPTTTAPPASSSSTTGAAPSGSTPASTPASGSAGLAVESSSSYGKILANAKGFTLYMLSTESATKVTCTGQCATIWPPLTVTAVPAFGKGVSQSLVGQVTRSDGSHQLTYGGHPLYTFSFDKAPHQTNGEGIHSFGGTWSVLSASTGKPVAKGGASSSSSTSTTTYGAGY